MSGENAAPSVGLDTAATTSEGGLRKNGKNWHARRSAFRPGKSMSSFDARRAKEKALDVTKKREAFFKAEKAREKQEMVDKIRERRAKKEEKERWERMEEKMNRKRVERLKRREKRNKMLKS